MVFALDFESGGLEERVHRPFGLVFVALDTGAAVLTRLDLGNSGSCGNLGIFLFKTT